MSIQMSIQGNFVGGIIPTAEQVGAAPIGSVWTATDTNNDGNIVLKRGAVINGGSGGGSSGGLTAEEVQAMIDAALGGIENGSY